MKTQEEKKSRKWTKRVLAALGIALLLLVIVGGITLYKSARTVMSAEKVDDGIYKITYQNDYKLDKALSANIKTEQDLIDFISDTFFLGIPVDANQDYVACSACSVSTISTPCRCMPSICLSPMRRGIPPLSNGS